MFSFDGDFRRKRVQNLGGESKKHDRSELIRKAQNERQKREITRRKNHGAIILQSCVRSFILRQRIKKIQRNKFDEFIKIKGLKNIDDLGYLLKRLLFFYCTNNISDGERLIFICQYILRNPQLIFTNIHNNHNNIQNNIWQYRINKILGLCMDQLFVTELSSAIPFRMLEVYSSIDEIIKYVPDINKNLLYLTNIFSHLIRKKYFKQIRRLIDIKVPYLDEQCHLPPNQASETVLHMLLRPLKLVKDLSTSLNYNILTSFTFHILSPEFSEAIKYFILPALANNPEFPYLSLIVCLSEFYQKQIDIKNMILIDIDDDENTNTTTKNKLKTTKNDEDQQEPIFSTYLLYSILKLDTIFLDKFNTTNTNVIANYIQVLASMTQNISKLPKKSHHSMKNDDSSDSDINDENKHNTQIIMSGMEREILQDIVQMLNDTQRISFIVYETENLLNNTNFIHCICQICHDLMTYNRLAIFENNLLYMLAFKPNFIRTLWYNLTQTAQTGFSSPISLLSKGLSICKYDADKIIPILATFCALFGRLISTLHDGEFCHEDVLPGTTSKIMPFTLDEIIPLSTTLKEICLGLVELAFPETRSSLKENYRSVLSSFHLHGGSRSEIFDKNIWPNLLKVCVSLLRQLHTRDLRRSFCPDNHWTAQTLNLPLDKPTDLHLQRGNRRGPRPFQPIRDFTREDLEDGPPLSIKQIRSITILREIPFVVQFNTRVGVFQGLLAADKLRTQGDLQGFLQGPSIQLIVRRSHLYEDAFDKLSTENEPDLRPRFRVQMINKVGLEEVGIDGGGVFRECLSELIKTAFDPHRGFFMITTDNKLYPNPSVGKIIEDYQRHYFFIGRILGKAMYENLLVELPLAEFFLTKLAGKHSDVDVHQLASLDPVLHRNLLSLKAFDGDVAELGLDFTVVCDELGETRVEELKPNGVNINVNSSNLIEYIQLMADFKLNKQIRKQCNAFRQGLANILPIEWLYMFSNKELQVLISGAEIPVDIEDLKKHTRYGGDFNLNHKTIIHFWNVILNFTDIQKRQLLKFVTSCSRPPLLGFKDLDPPFCISNAGDTDRLPSSSTCMNLLKLPAFSDEEILKEKLLYAIQSNSGFELS